MPGPESLSPMTLLCVYLHPLFSSKGRKSQAVLMEQRRETQPRVCFDRHWAGERCHCTEQEPSRSGLGSHCGKWETPELTPPPDSDTGALPNSVTGPVFSCANQRHVLGVQQCGGESHVSPHPVETGEHGGSRGLCELSPHPCDQALRFLPTLQEECRETHPRAQTCTHFRSCDVRGTARQAGQWGTSQRRGTEVRSVTSSTSFKTLPSIAFPEACPDSWAVRGQVKDQIKASSRGAWSPALLTDPLSRVPAHVTAWVELGCQWEPSRASKKMLV
ncbi:hypothetical protein AAY473_025258 [Plecturocebus cupreus]